MKKFINEPEHLVNELLEGYTLAYPENVTLVGENLVARRVPKADGYVGIVTLGGSGHEPGLSGYVGRGMLDISVPGEIFAAPGPPRCLEALKMADRGAGVLFVVLNHAGDVMTANLTMDMAKKDGLNVKMVVVHDDMSSGLREHPEERRGLVGALPVFKIAGAAAEEGRSLDDIHELSTHVAENMCTLAVALRSATHPATGNSLFSLGDHEMEIGMGQHGEAGTGRRPLQSANDTADVMLSQLLDDLDVRGGQELLVILNSAGATTYMELFIIFRRVHQMLTKKNIRVARSKIGAYITTQEQAGFQMCLTRLNQELLRLWDAPCDTPYFTVV